jgi:1-acyl-sn-glycerol-3-phosphate acyltransferase
VARGERESEEARPWLPFQAVGEAVGEGLDLVGRMLGGTSATASAMAEDLIGARPDDPLEERDPDFIRATLPAYRLLARLYFRPKVRGLEQIPPDGPVLLVGNHSGGTLIVDTFAFAYAFYTHFGVDRRFYQLAHDLAVKLPALSALLRKYGTIPASHDNARQALAAGAAVLVYPGGDYETFRPSWHSSEVEFGGRHGFIRLAIAQDVPIVPVVAIGGQETALFLTRGERLARLLQLDRLLRLKVLPLQVAPPFGVTVLDLPGRIPLPSQITIQVLPKLELRDQFGPKPDQDEVFNAITDQMQWALDELAEERDLPVVGSVGARGSESGAVAAALADHQAVYGADLDGAADRELVRRAS